MSLLDILCIWGKNYILKGYMVVISYLKYVQNISTILVNLSKILSKQSKNVIISCGSVLLIENTVVSGENHRLFARNGQNICINMKGNYCLCTCRWKSICHIIAATVAHKPHVVTTWTLFFFYIAILIYRIRYNFNINAL